MENTDQEEQACIAVVLQHHLSDAAKHAVEESRQEWRRGPVINDKPGRRKAHSHLSKRLLDGAVSIALPTFIVGDDLRLGRLRTVLKDYQAPDSVTTGQIDHVLALCYSVGFSQFRSSLILLVKSRTRQAIVEAARKLFSTWGYDGASMDAIAAEARVTKVTVYRHFENKDALFSAALQSLFDELPTPQSVVFQEQGPLRTRLIGVAHKLLGLGTGPLMMRLQRMLSLPRESAPDTAEQLWETNFQPYHEAVKHLLTLEQETGVLKIVDVHVATTHLLSLIAGEPMIRLFLTGSASQDKAAADKHVRDAVEMFLRAYGTAARVH